MMLLYTTAAVCGAVIVIALGEALARSWRRRRLNPRRLELPYGRRGMRRGRL